MEQCLYPGTKSNASLNKIVPVCAWFCSRVEQIVDFFFSLRAEPNNRGEGGESFEFEPKVIWRAGS